MLRGLNILRGAQRLGRLCTIRIAGRSLYTSSDGVDKFLMRHNRAPDNWLIKWLIKWFGWSRHARFSVSTGLCALHRCTTDNYIIDWLQTKLKMLIIIVQSWNETTFVKKIRLFNIARQFLVAPNRELCLSNQSRHGPFNRSTNLCIPP